MFFLPEWYVKEEEERKCKLFKILLLIIIIVNIFLIKNLVQNIHKKRLLDKEINQRFEEKRNNEEQINKNKTGNDKTFETFLNFTKYLTEFNECESLNIYGKKIELELDSKRVDYMAFIRRIELNSEFTINQVIFSNNKNSDIVRINIELK